MTVTPTSFFNIVLKIFGLFFLREIINELANTVSLFARYFGVNDFSTSIAVIIFSILILCFYTFLVLQLIFRTNVIINILRLDKGFSETEFSFEKPTENKISLTTAEILKISLIILGGYILVDEIPNLCKQAYLFIDEGRSFYKAAAPGISNIVETCAKIIIALLILGEHKKIIEFIVGKINNKLTDVI